MVARYCAPHTSLQENTKYRAAWRGTEDYRLWGGATCLECKSFGISIRFWSMVQSSELAIKEVSPQEHTVGLSQLLIRSLITLVGF
jgi:hypothetical protein